MSAIDDLLAQWAPNPDEIKRQQQSALFMNIAGGLLGARRGQELQGLGQGLLGGGIAAHRVRQDAQQEALRRMQMRSAGIDYLGKEQSYNDDQQFRAIPRYMPSQSPQPATAGYGMADRSMGQAPAPAQQPAQTGDPYTDAMAEFEHYRRLGAPPKYLQKLRDDAIKLRPKSHAQNIQGVDQTTGLPAWFAVNDAGGQQRLPIGVAPEMMQIPLGDRIEIGDKNDPRMVGRSFAVGQSPDNKATVGEQARSHDQNYRVALGNLGVAQGNLKVNQGELGIKEKQLEQGKWVNDLDKGVQINTTNGQTRPIMAGTEPIGTKDQFNRANSARNIGSVLDEADKVIDKATGSYAGAAFDAGQRVFGTTTTGASAIAKLKVLEGNIMLNQPRMEGPQSNLDVQLYRDMAGQIGDPTIPVAQKKAALATIRELTQKYQRGGGSQARPGGTVDFNSLPK